VLAVGRGCRLESLVARVSIVPASVCGRGG
jgi:hypothetical protein